MQDHTIDVALQDAGVDQSEERLEQHLADAIEALLEWPGLGSCELCGTGRKTLHDAVELNVVAVADHEPLRQRITDLPDPDLQRAAVADQTGGIQSDRIFGVADRLGRRREQREIGVGTVEHGGEFIRRQIAGSRHERQFRIDLAEQLE